MFQSLGNNILIWKIVKFFWVCHYLTNFSGVILIWIVGMWCLRDSMTQPARIQFRRNIWHSQKVCKFWSLFVYRITGAQTCCHITYKFRDYQSRTFPLLQFMNWKSMSPDALESTYFSEKSPQFLHYSHFYYTFKIDHVWSIIMLVRITTVFGLWELLNNHQ